MSVRYANYAVKKINNNEYREIKKKFKLNVNRFVGDTSQLFFDVDNSETHFDPSVNNKESFELPFLMEVNSFFGVIAELINNGLVESLTYDKDKSIMNITMRDGNTIKHFEYDFCLDQFDRMNLHYKTKEDLEKQIFGIMTLYRFSPISYASSEQKYLKLIYDIMDRDRDPRIEDPNELRRIFEVYNAHRQDILEKLLDNVVFYDGNDNIINYRGLLRIKKLDAIRYDILQQMELAMLLFAVKNNAEKQYREYLDNTNIEEIQITYKFVDADGNEVDAPPEIEGGTIFSLTREIIRQKLLKVKALSEKLGKPAVDRIKINGFGRILKKKETEEE